MIMKKTNLISVSGKINSGKDTVGKIIQYLTSNPSVSFDNWENELGGISYEEASNWQIKKFASKVKDMVCLLLGCTREDLEDREFKEKELGEEWWYFKTLGLITSRPYILKPYIGNEHLSKSDILHTYKLIKLTPRLLMQLLGTDAGRDIIHPNIWVNSLFADYKPLRSIKAGIVDFNENTSDLETIYTEYPNWIITDTRFPNEVEAIKQRGGINIRVNRKQNNYYLPLKHYEGLHRNNMLNGNIETIRKYFHPSETALDNYQDWDYVIDNSGSLEDLIEKVKNILIDLKIIE